MCRRTVGPPGAHFVAVRMLVQWFYYSPDVWRGDRFRTAVHYVFSMAWIYVTATFAASLWSIVSRRA